MKLTFFLLVLFVLAVSGLYWLSRIGATAQGADWGSRGLNRLDGLNRFFCARFHRLQTEPLNLPASGGAVVVCNHVSGLDPMLLLAASPRPLRFLIAQSEFDRWWLQWLFKRVKCIPVRRSGRVDKSLNTARIALQDGELLALFPQGRLVPAGSPAVKLKRGAVYLADLAQVPIIPLRLEGVAGQGMTILAVFVRGRVRLRVGEVLPADLDADQRMRAIEAFITGSQEQSV